MMVALFLWLALLGEKPLLVHHETDCLKLTLPQAVVSDPALSRRLLSGLTTSIELETHLDGRDGKRVERALLMIRYDVWEERIELNLKEWGGVSKREFATLEALFAYLTQHGIRAAPLSDADYPLKLRVICRVIPYSSEEAQQTRDWFSQRLKVARATEQGLIANEGSTRPGDVGIFEILMSSGIGQRASQEYRWKWRLTGRPGP